MAIYYANKGGGGGGLLPWLQFFSSMPQQKQEMERSAAENTRAKERHEREKIDHEQRVKGFPLLTETAATNLALGKANLTEQEAKNAEAARVAGATAAERAAANVLPDLFSPETLNRPMVPGTLPIFSELGEDQPMVKEWMSARGVDPGRMPDVWRNFYQSQTEKPYPSPGQTITQAQRDASGNFSVQSQPTERVEAEKEAAQTKWQRETAKDLYAKFKSLPPVQNLYKARGSYKGLQEVVEAARPAKPGEEDRGTGTGDIAIVYNFMHVIEPTSTVKEGEFATADQAGGKAAKFLNLYNSVVSGERLRPGVREDFLKTAGHSMAGHATVVEDLRQRELDEAADIGVSTEYFNPTPFGEHDPSRGQQSKDAGSTPENPAVVKSKAERDAVLQAGGFTTDGSGRVAQMINGRVVEVGRIVDGKFVSARPEGNPGAPLPAALPNVTQPVDWSAVLDQMPRNPPPPPFGVLPGFILPDLRPPGR